MDFASLMSAQISSSKPKAEPSSSKYKRRADLEKEREAAYAAEQEKLERERSERAAKKRKLDEEEAEQNAAREEKRRRMAEEARARRERDERAQENERRKRVGLPELKDEEDDEGAKHDEDLPEIEDAELREKLRELEEPVALFEESHHMRLRRYYTITSPHLLAPSKAKIYPGPIPTTLEPLPEADLLLPSSMPSPTDTAASTRLHRQLASYLTLLLTTWSTSLSARPPSIASSASGRAALASYQNTLADLAPLYHRLETQTLPPALLHPLTSILAHTQQRRYRDATDAYIQLAVGRAAWPIGVTMVGIHERSAREKLHEPGGEAGKAQIMRDEATRKWLQCVKRLVSWAQGRWPPQDLAQLMG